MTKKELIRELNVLFGKDRAKLKEKLGEVIENIDYWEILGSEIKKVTGQPVMGGVALFDETIENINEKADMFWTGDCSFKIEILLNSGAKSGLDWDKKLGAQFRGGAKICEVWVSLVLPYFAVDYYKYKYIPERNEFIYEPYQPNTKREKKILEKLHKLMGEKELKLVSKRLAMAKVPKAITDIRNKGEATVFDCLFSDTSNFNEDICRFADGPVPCKPIDEIFPETKIDWREIKDKKGKSKERYISLVFLSGESVVIHLDKDYKLERIYTCQNKCIMSLDVKNRKFEKPKGK